MLGTRVILMGMDRHPNSGSSTHAEVLCAANHQIPFFWFLLFGSADLEAFSLDEGNSYPLLIAQREHVLKQLKQRVSYFKTSLTDKERVLLKRWLDYVQSCDDPWFAIDTYELWKSYETPAQLKDDMRAVLEGLDQSGIALDALIKKGQWQRDNEINLCGYGW